MKSGKRGKKSSAAGDSGTRCTACKGGWVEFKVTKETPIRSDDGKSIIGSRQTVGVTNTKCGTCDGTGWR